MKRIIYFLSTLLFLALYSCYEQYENIEQYATDETIYVGKYDDMPDVKIGYKRVEIDLMSERYATDDIYLGKAIKTVVEYDEPYGRRKREYPGVRSWVNVTELATPKTYIFSIYTEDTLGNKSIPVEALGKPFTDDELAGYSFPLPRSIPAPTTMEFRWSAESGLSSSLFNFVALDYSYVNRNDDTITGTLTSQDSPYFVIGGLLPVDNITVTVACRIIPKMESGPIIDTITMIREFSAKTASAEDYLSARTLRQVKSAMIDNGNTSNAVITWDVPTEHLAWTEIEYIHSDGTPEVVHVSNYESETLCTDIKRGVKFKIRGIYSPEEGDELYTDWTGEGMFEIKYDRRDWVVVSRNAYFSGWGSSPELLWAGGHPMLIFDDDFVISGWHASLSNNLATLPQVLIIDMKQSIPVSNVILYCTSDYELGYWKNIDLYLTDNLPLPDYVSHTVNWESEMAARIDNYTVWFNAMRVKFPADGAELPFASWGAPVAQAEFKEEDRKEYLSISLPQTGNGRYLIVSFPNNKFVVRGDNRTFISVREVEVYSE
jgi:hypothetical protein